VAKGLFRAALMEPGACSQPKQEGAEAAHDARVAKGSCAKAEERLQGLRDPLAAAQRSSTCGQGDTAAPAVCQAITWACGPGYVGYQPTECAVLPVGKCGLPDVVRGDASVADTNQAASALPDDVQGDASPQEAAEARDRADDSAIAVRGPQAASDDDAEATAVDTFDGVDHPVELDRAALAAVDAAQRATTG